jgi:hypothetical protein
MRKVTDAKALTTEQPFFRHAVVGSDFFRFAAGVPVRDALEHASVHLAVADGMLDPDGIDGNGVWAVSFLIQSAKAAIDAAVNGLIRHDNRASRGTASDQEEIGEVCEVVMGGRMPRSVEQEIAA